MQILKKTTIIFFLFISITFAQAWIPSVSGTSEILYHASFLDTNNGFTTGEKGVILKTTDSGFTWVKKSSGVSSVIFSVCYISNTLVIGVGYNGVILRSVDAGESWTKINSGTTNALSYVYFINESVGYIVGYNGTILKSTDSGLSWNAQISGTTSYFGCVKFTDTNNGIIVGQNGVILRTLNGGTNWIGEISGTTNYLRFITFIDSQNAVVSGDNGTILRTNNAGQTWGSIYSGTSKVLRDIDFYNYTNGCIVGQDGTMLKTTDSGQSWTIQPLVTNEYLVFIKYFSSNRAVSGGVNGFIMCLRDASISVATPNGGESFNVGDVAQINWTATGISIVKIDYTTNNGSSWITIVNSVTGGGSNTWSGVYNWIVPNTVSNNCKVKVSYVTDVSLNDQSDNTFTIGQPQYNVVTNTSPANAGIVSGAGTYDRGSNVTVIATANNGYTFSNWSEGNTVVSTNSSYTFIISSSRELTAKFSPNSYTLSVTAANGTVTKSPEQSNYIFGTQVQLTATPNTGYSFIGWSGNASGSTNPLTVTMDGNKSIIANFLLSKYTLAVTSANGTVTKNPDLTSYNHGTVVTLTASASPGYAFSSWSGDINGTENPIAVTVEKNFSVIANYKKVNRPPVFTKAFTDTTIDVHNVQVLFKYKFAAADPDGDVVSFRLDSGPNGATMSSNGLFSWVPSTTQAGQGFIVMVTISDGDLSETKVASLKTNSVIVNIDGNAVPSVFSLSQNYPNPFNPTTKIQFSIPKETYVSLTVYNAIGQEISKLVNQHLSPATYSITFDASKHQN
ncbi:MAG: YCF48-related protein, partial [Ignavibacteria bacterium]|nr:YCF48-related protein [Ignavibacteria bacterium]